MRETEFISANREKWNSYEDYLERDNPDPEELQKIYTNLCEDLSYAQTFYPNRSIRVYLNNLSQNYSVKFHGAKGRGISRIWRFFDRELPEIILKHKASF